MPDGSTVTYLLLLSYYAGVVIDWNAQLTGHESAIIMNLRRRLEAAVLWEYVLAPVRTVEGETHKNSRVPV